MSGSKPRRGEPRPADSHQRLRDSYTAGLSQPSEGGSQESLARAELVFLAEASYRLAASLDSTETLNVAADLAALAIDGSSFVYLRGDSGAPERVAQAGPCAEPEEDCLAGLGGDLASLMQVLGSGQSLVLAPAETPVPSGGTQRDAPARLIVALCARGCTLGAMLVGRFSPATFHPGEIALVEELGRRIGLALDNARLYGHAEANLQAQKRLIAVAAHELRSPLGALRLALQIGLSRYRRGEALNPVLLEKAIAQTDRLDGLISSILDQSQTDVKLPSSAPSKSDHPGKPGSS